MDAAELKIKIAEYLKNKFPDMLADIQEFRGEITIQIPAEKIKDVCDFLKTSDDLDFDFLSDITAVDHLAHDRKPRFDVLYNLYSISNKHRLRIKCQIDEPDPKIDSVVMIWQTADFLERETYDMFGIVFEGHPNLTRILMPDDWQGFPLRKDFPLGGVKSFYFKRDTNPHKGEPPDLVQRIRVQEGDI